MPSVSFAKMHGLGNDFMVIDSLRQTLPSGFCDAAHIRRLAHRHLGIGFDQLLLLSAADNTGADTTPADFNYRIFNADGGEVGQCGNGVRCAHSYLLTNQLTSKTELTFTTVTTHIRSQRIDAAAFRATMPAPEYAEPLSESGLVFERLFLGNPHAVCFTGDDNDISADTINRIGTTLNRTINGGINVGFAKIAAGTIHLQVYERGVGITAACGSGALAAAATAIAGGRTPNPVAVQMPGGTLQCGTNPDTDIWMQGEVCTVFNGTLPAPA